MEYAREQRTIEEYAVQKLAAGLRGELVRLQDHGYDTVRTVFNGMIDKRPAMIVRCAGTYTYDPTNLFRLHQAVKPTTHI